MTGEASIADRYRLSAAGDVLNLSPRCGELPPDQAWPYLERVAERLHLAGSPMMYRPNGPDLGGALSSPTTYPPPKTLKTARSGDPGRTTTDGERTPSKDACVPRASKQELS